MRFLKVVRSVSKENSILLFIYFIFQVIPFENTFTPNWVSIGNLVFEVDFTT